MEMAREAEVRCAPGRCPCGDVEPRSCGLADARHGPRRRLAPLHSVRPAARKSQRGDCCAAERPRRLARPDEALEAAFERGGPLPTHNAFHFSSGLSALLDALRWAGEAARRAEGPLLRWLARFGDVSTGGRLLALERGALFCAVLHVARIGGRDSAHRPR
jgi:hypothetical protein